MGLGIPVIAGAKALIDKVKSLNGKREVPANEAKAGDLVYLYGPSYGAMKDSKGNGWHVGFYLGNGRMADSSNRSIRKSKPVPDGAKFVPVPYGMAPPSDGKGYGVQNQGVKSTLPKNPPPGGAKPTATPATKPEAKKPAVKTSKQYNSNTATAPSSTGSATPSGSRPASAATAAGGKACWPFAFQTS